MTSPLRTFIETIYQWDGEEANSYKVFTTVYKPADGAQRFVPHGYQNIDAFERSLRYWIGRGETVYTANASFRDAQGVRSGGSTNVRRAVDNVSRVKVLFLDIDVGPNKPYPDVAAARASLDHMCKESGLWPPTFVVESGGGIHAYWAMAEAIDYLRWHTLAERLKTCCKIYKLQADEVVTADGARILRPPESFNYKYDSPVQVMLHTTGSFYTVEQMEACARALRHQGGRRQAVAPEVGGYSSTSRRTSEAGQRRQLRRWSRRRSAPGAGRRGRSRRSGLRGGGGRAGERRHGSLRTALVTATSAGDLLH